MRARRAVLAGAMAVVMAVMCHSLSAAAEQASTGTGGIPRLQGTFLQLQRPHITWQPGDWQGLFRHLKELKVNYLVIQWLAHDGVEFYRAAADGGASTVGTILNLAADHEIKVSSAWTIGRASGKRSRGGANRGGGFLARIPGTFARHRRSDRERARSRSRARCHPP